MHSRGVNIKCNLILSPHYVHLRDSTVQFFLLDNTWPALVSHCRLRCSIFVFHHIPECLGFNRRGWAERCKLGIGLDWSYGLIKIQIERLFLKGVILSRHTHTRHILIFQLFSFSPILVVPSTYQIFIMFLYWMLFVIAWIFPSMHFPQKY